MGILHHGYVNRKHCKLNIVRNESRDEAYENELFSLYRSLFKGHLRDKGIQVKNIRLI